MCNVVLWSFLYLSLSLSLSLSHKQSLSRTADIKAFKKKDIGHLQIKSKPFSKPHHTPYKCHVMITWLLSIQLSDVRTSPLLRATWLSRLAVSVLLRRSPVPSLPARSGIKPSICKQAWIVKSSYSVLTSILVNPKIAQVALYRCM